MLKTKPTKLWLLVAICAVLASAGVVTAHAQTQEVKLYDDPRVLRWSADFLAGKREQVLRSVEADLKSTTPHPLSTVIWAAVQHSLTGKEPGPGDVKDEKLKRSLFVLLDVVNLVNSSEYRELLRRYPAASADRITDLWALQTLFNIAIEECRYDDAYLFGVRLAKLNPDPFDVSRLFVNNLIEKERIRSKIAALFEKEGDLGKTEIGRLLQAELSSSLTGSMKEQQESKLLEDWLKRFPYNPSALDSKGNRLAASGKYEEAAKTFLQADSAFPFTGSYKEAARMLIYDGKREQAETLLKERASLMTKDRAAAADESEELLAEVLTDTHDSSSPERGESALAILEKALARRHDSPYLFTLAARAAAVTRSSEKMLKYAKGAFELGSDKPEYFLFLLSYLIDGKKYGEAQALFTIGESKFRQRSQLFWLLGIRAWLEYDLEPGVTILDSIKPEVWQILRRARQDYPESAQLMVLEGFLLNFVNKQAEGRDKLKLAFTLNAPTPLTIEWLLRLQTGLTVEEREAEFRELAKRYPRAAPEFEKYIRKLELYVQTGPGDVTSVAFSQDGMMLAAGTRGGGVKLWDAATGDELNTLSQEMFTPTINCIAFSSDRKTVATGSRVIKLWDISSTKPLLTLTDHTDDINSIAFSPNQKVLASGSDDKTVKLWSLATGEVIKSLSHSGEVESISFSPDGKTIAAGGEGKTTLWTTATGKELKTIDSFDLPIFFVDGNLIAGQAVVQTANQKPYYTVNILNVATGQKVRTMDGAFTDPLHLLALSPDNKLLAAAGGGDVSKHITVWEVSTGRILHKLPEHQNSTMALAFSPDNRVLASAGADGTVRLWNPVTGQELLNLRKRVSPTYSYEISPDGKWFASRYDKAINLWDLAGNLGLSVLSGHTVWVNSFTFSPNSSTLASGSYDGVVKLWDMATTSELRTLRTGNGQITSLKFSPNSNSLAIGSEEGDIKLWDIARANELRTLSSDKGRVTTVEFSPDGKLLASVRYTGREDGRTYATEVRALDSGRILLSLTGGQIQIKFSANSKFLTSYGGGIPIQLWSLATGNEAVALKGQTDGAAAIVFSADSRLLAAFFGETKAIRFWDVQTGNELTYDAVPDWASDLKRDSRSTWVSSSLRIESTQAGLKLIDNNYQTVATLFAFDDGGWIVLDRDGRFDASPSAEKLMHYNYGLQIIGLDQLKEMYYAPGLLSKLLGHNRERLPAVISLKEIKLHPEIVSHTLSPDSTRLSITLKNLGGGIGETRVLVNDKLVVPDARDAALKANPNIPIGSTVTLTADLRGASILKGKKNKITIISSNYLSEIGRGNIQSRGADIYYVDSRKEETQLPSLYAIVGGVSDYEGNRIDLRFAAKDAEDFSSALSLAARRLYCPPENLKCLDKVKIRTLTTARPGPENQPTKENFRKAFAWVAQQAQPEDIVVIYLAGHGVTFANGTDNYFFLTKDAHSTSAEDLAKVYQTTAISNTELTDWLTLDRNVPDDIFIKSQRQLIILDTCAAGNFGREDHWNTARELSGDQIRAMEFLRGKTGTFILMGSANSQPSYEASRFNQGLLTYALLEGMRGAAVRSATSDVEVRLLLTYAEKRVPELAREMQLEQKPVIKQPTGNGFLVGKMIAEDRLQINLPLLKPLLLRPRLTNPAEANDDNLNLNQELSNRFDLESSYEVMRRSGRGEPVLIYLDEDNFPGATRITGTYTVEADKVRVKAFLRRDGSTIATLPEIVATRETLLEKVVEAVRCALLRTANHDIATPPNPKASLCH